MSKKSVEEFIDEVLEIENSASKRIRNAELTGAYSKTNVKKIENDVINDILNLLIEEDTDEN